MADLTPRQVEILEIVAAASEAGTVHVRPGGNTDAASLTMWHGNVPAPGRDEGASYARVLYPLRDAGLLTIASQRTTRGRLVAITDHGRLTLTARTSRGLPGIQARLQLAPSRASVERFLDLATDAHRMARVLREIERELDRAERNGKSEVPVSWIRRELREVDRG